MLEVTLSTFPQHFYRAKATLRVSALLGGACSAYYAWLERENDPSKQSRRKSRRSLKTRPFLAHFSPISRELVKLHGKYPTLGLDPLHQMLKPLFGVSAIGVSRKRVWRLKNQLGIRSTRHKAYRRTTNSNHSNPVALNLIGGRFSATKPSQVWVSDINYVPTGQGWLYCVVIKDLFLKKAVGYAFNDRMNTRLCLDALNMAIYRQRPKSGLIFHSDRGIQYASSALHPIKPKPGYIHLIKPKPKTGL